MTQISCIESTLVTVSGPHDFLDLLRCIRHPGGEQFRTANSDYEIVLHEEGLPMDRRLRFKSDRSTRAKRFLREILIWVQGVKEAYVYVLTPRPRFDGFSGQ